MLTEWLRGPARVVQAGWGQLAAGVAACILLSGANAYYLPGTYPREFLKGHIIQGEVLHAFWQQARLMQWPRLPAGMKMHRRPQTGCEVAMLTGRGHTESRLPCGAVNTLQCQSLTDCRSPFGNFAAVSPCLTSVCGRIGGLEGRAVLASSGPGSAWPHCSLRPRSRLGHAGPGGEASACIHGLCGLSARSSPPLPRCHPVRCHAERRAKGAAAGAAADVNSLVSPETELPYDYYSMPFCLPPEGVRSSAGSINPGTILMGSRIENSPYNFTVKVPRRRLPCWEGGLLRGSRAAHNRKSAAV